MGGAPNVLADALISTLPPAVLSGARLKVKAGVHVTNRAGSTVAGAAVVTLYLSADQTVDAADAQVGVLRTTVRLPAGAGKNLSVKLGAVPPLADGAYHLLATLRRPDLGTDVVAADSPLSIAAPAIDLRATKATLAAPSVARGRTTTLALTVENRGNIPARGVAAVRLLTAASPDPAAARNAFVTVPLRVNLQPGRAGTIRVKFIVPPELSPGGYTLLAELQAGSLTGATVTVDPSPVNAGVLSVL